MILAYLICLTLLFFWVWIFFFFAATSAFEAFLSTIVLFGFLWFWTSSHCFLSVLLILHECGHRSINQDTSLLKCPIASSMKLQKIKEESGNIWFIYPEVYSAPSLWLKIDVFKLFLFRTHHKPSHGPSEIWDFELETNWFASHLSRSRCILVSSLVLFVFSYFTI